ncbi:hypothetical protein [Kamptonema formosum]|uniref:hypothetical protein n=1 Tax=Kamptonema formosum TaxID=331992 RepID=UPI000475DB05|nr:hypothetical protein [Oscillatoria sp. PCC 10802]
MTPHPSIMQAVEQLGYRVTTGDVASKAGLELNLAERGLLALASDAGGHLQVAETGDIVYLFPKDFRAILRNKYLQLQLKEWWEKVWRVLFYLIRISFGIALLLSILLIFLTIAVIIITVNSSNRDSNNRNDSRSSGGGIIFVPNFWFGPNWYWFLSWDYDSPHRHRQSQPREMNFLEAVYSFLFGDGNPNADLEERRWQEIATVIRNSKGAVVAEQIAPYLDELGEGYAKEYEEYMLPVLTRFNGRPEVSPEGQIVYHFPDLQTAAQTRKSQPVSPYLQEIPRRFSRATSGQLMLAAGLGILNFVGGLVLGSLLKDSTVAAQLGGLVAFTQSIYWLLLGYGTAFLAVPLIRYFWQQWRNRKIEARNQTRQERADILTQPDEQLQKKLEFARRFAAERIIGSEDLAYTTETDLIEQEMQQSAKIDAEWQRRLHPEI